MNRMHSLKQSQASRCQELIEMISSKVHFNYDRNHIGNKFFLTTIRFRHPLQVSVVQDVRSKLLHHGKPRTTDLGLHKASGSEAPQRNFIVFDLEWLAESVVTQVP